MQNHETCLMVVQFATIAASAVTSIKAQQGAASDMSDAADLEGTGITVAADDDNQLFWIEVTKPQERYVRLYVDKDATNACAESAVYYIGGGKCFPEDNNVDDTITGELHVSPDEGTA
jgi:hypothetical protein